MSKGSNHEADESINRSNCVWCEDVDNDKMIICKVCEKIYHQKCANSEPFKNFVCQDCKKAKKGTSTTIEFPNTRHQQSLKDESGKIAASSQYQKEDHSKEPVQKILGNGENAKESSIKSKRSSMNSNIRRNLEMKKLDEEMNLFFKQQEEKHKSELEFLKKRQQLDESFRSGSSRKSEASSCAASLDRTKEWVENQSNPINSHSKVRFEGNQAKTSREPFELTHSSGNNNLGKTRRDHTDVNAETSRNSTPWLDAPNHEQFVRSIRNLGLERQPYVETNMSLSAEQISSRQVLPKDLPIFTGIPEEWPLFISSFVNSTKQCGFTNAENLIRLQKSLKGNALNSVRGKLMIPEMVPDVLSVLRMLYGRPDQLLQSLMQKIRREPIVKHEALDQLVRFALMVQNLCATMEASHLTGHLSNPMLLQELVEKLPATIKLNWAMNKRNYENIDLSVFNSWLFNIAEAASDVCFSLSDLSSTKPGVCHTSVNVTSAIDSPCFVCEGNHKIEECVQFQNLNKRDRWDVIIRNRRCGKCFGPHYYRRCQSRKECGVDGCRRMHHELLHNTTHESSQAPDISDPIEHSHNVHRSSITLMDGDVATMLQLKGPEEELCLRWTGGTTRAEKSSRRVSLEISGQQIAKRYRLSDVRTVKNLDLPMQSLNKDDLVRDFAHLKDIPILGYENAAPRILIGVAHWALGLPLESREGRLGEPIATKSRLGWIVSGGIGTVNPIEAMHYHLCECGSDDDLHKEVKKYFSLENFGVRKTETILESRNDRQAREILEKTTRRIGDKFETGLLWNEDSITLPDSKPMALQRYECLKKKIKNNETLQVKLNDKIEEYVNKGYARKLTEEEAGRISPRTWYLPVFTVVNPNKPQKFRMVWDAAATVNGVSLNSKLLQGPDLLTPLPEVLLRFRQYKVALCGDIREMFHQIKIKPSDRQSQRFLWSNTGSGDVSTYEMIVMTFGAKCSPCAAQYIKNLNAEEYADRYPEASQAILRNHYVDDWLQSFATLEEAVKIAKDVRYVHSMAGFEIRGWRSNCKLLLEYLGEEPSTTKRIDLNVGEEINGSKVLGMWWETEGDNLYFSIDPCRVDGTGNLLNGSQRPTKRQVLRVLMMIFDPLGLISCFLVYVKILLQDIWRTSIGWDEGITDRQMEKWAIWTKTLPNLHNVKIPRCYTGMLSEPLQPTVDLHIFVDASENAYSAVAYFRVEEAEKVKCVLVSAKTKVAPQKPLSIPRLELQAAVLGTRLAESIKQAHTIDIRRRIFWSDSMNVLSWIRSDARRYVQFVAFRIGEILEGTEVSEWRYVPTFMNVADEATKWVEAPKLLSTSRWFVGPEFLYLTAEEWPKEQNKGDFTLHDCELRVNVHQHELLQPSATPDPRNFSRWKVFLRTQVLVLRVLKRQGSLRPISAEELREAEREIFRSVQRDAYANEVKDLSKGKEKTVAKNSKIFCFTPFLDENKILRMRGRTKEAEGISNDAKDPILIPHDSKITELLLASYHRRYHHQNGETVVNEVRQRFWVPQLRSTLKKIRSNCQRCKNDRARPQPPMMANLPKARLATFTRPFTFVGIDYFGPIEIVIGRRVEKRWGALFTCLTIRAVHLEIVTNLTSDSSIMALRNFIARRGCPREIWSDNGTNFRGANTELRRELQKINKDELMTYFDTVDWHFIPPSAPHMGGCWERLVRSVKSILTEILPSRKPSEELLRTCLLEAESIINNRPLTYIPVEHDAKEALTPNHFLLGSSSGGKPIGEFTDEVLVLRKNYKISQNIADNFWRRWIREYLPTITRRTKWFSFVKPVEVGDIGVIWDDNKRGSWQKGKVIDIVVAKDGQVRQVVVKTITGVYTKPVTKFAKLDVVDKPTKLVNN